jgi:hypothetical protein
MTRFVITIKTRHVVHIFAQILVEPFSSKFATISMVLALLLVPYKLLFSQYLLTGSKSICLNFVAKE